MFISFRFHFELKVATTFLRKLFVVLEKLFVSLATALSAKPWVSKRKLIIS